MSRSSTFGAPELEESSSTGGVEGLTEVAEEDLTSDISNNPEDEKRGEKSVCNYSLKTGEDFAVILEF